MKRTRITTATGALALIVALGASPALARNLNPGILPPNSTPHGSSYAEWSVKWWQWVFSLPARNSPILDTGDCSAGQSDHVWFLAGAFAPTTVTRACTIPPGTALFFPLVNGWRTIPAAHILTSPRSNWRALRQALWSRPG